MPAMEIARFRVREGAEQSLLAERPAMLAALRERFPAAGDAHLARLDDGTWVDVIVWSSREEADRAQREVFDHPEIAGWFGHISEVVAMEHGELAAA